MNSTGENSDRLDELLADWSKESVSPEQLENLRARVVSSLMDSSSAAQADDVVNRSTVFPPAARWIAPSSRFAPGNRGMSGFAISVSVAAMLLAGVFLSRWNIDPVSTAVSEPPVFARFQDEQIQHKIRLLSEMQTIFGEHLVWFAETDQQMEFGLNDSETRAKDGDQLAVRVVVQQRPSGATAWQLAWAMDVVSRSEDVVYLAPPQANGNELRLWAYRLPDGAIAVDSEIRLAGDVPFHVQASELHQNHHPIEVVLSCDDGTEYRVFQAATVLDRTVI